MTGEKISREEFDRLQEAYLELAVRLREGDRHARGGTTIRESVQNGTFVDALIELLNDPEHIRREVARRAELWLGERGGKYSSEGWLARGVLGTGKVGDYETSPTPTELGTRAARAQSMTERKAGRCVDSLRESAKLCFDLAHAFEARLQAEGGIRRVQ